MAAGSFLAVVLVMTLVNAVPKTYGGRQPEAPWREQARKRIDRFRKGRIEVCVVDAQGRPVREAGVRLAQRSHLFRFGTVVSAERLLEDSPQGERYRQAFLDNFNSATVPKFYDFIWLDPERPKRSVPATLKCLEWLRSRGIFTHGHVLVWNFGRGGRKSKEPPDPDEAARRVDRHFARTIEQPDFAAGVQRWDVLNEPFENSEAFEILGVEQAAEWFARAHRADPEATLILNEAGLCSLTGRRSWSDRLDSTEKLVSALRDRGAPLHGLGLQAHHFDHPTAIERVWETLDRLSKLGLELMVTEYDMRSVPGAGPMASFEQRFLKPLKEPLGAELERLEADYLRDYLTICFSHPAVTEFTMWGFWDGDHWLHNSPLFRSDWSEKPALKEWRDLVYREWWTDQTLRTDAEGLAVATGFLGVYDIYLNGQKVAEIVLEDHQETRRLELSLSDS